MREVTINIDDEVYEFYLDIADVHDTMSVDMKLYAFEKGMGFNQDILIVKGEIINNLTINFEDYNWECICPTVGG